MTAILKRGDFAHMVMPCTASIEDDERVFAQLQEAYALHGVTLWVTSHEATVDFQIVAIFREDA